MERFYNIVFPEPDTDVEEEKDLDEETQLEPPYRVIIHNDNITTFAFVIDILQKLFEKSGMEAEQIAMRTHVSGAAYVGTYPKSDAEARVGKAHFAAGLEGYPLRFTIEPEEAS